MHNNGEYRRHRRRDRRIHHKLSYSGARNSSGSLLSTQFRDSFGLYGCVPRYWKCGIHVVGISSWAEKLLQRVVWKFEVDSLLVSIYSFIFAIIFYEHILLSCHFAYILSPFTLMRCADYFDVSTACFSSVALVSICQLLSLRICSPTTCKHSITFGKRRFPSLCACPSHHVLSVADINDL